MNKADEALADVRRWLCDNLSDGDAGKVCGMLSVVSRRIVEIEDENESLRELVRLLWKPFCWAQSGCEVCLTDEQEAEIRDKVRELGVEVDQ